MKSMQKTLLALLAGGAIGALVVLRTGAGSAVPQAPRPLISTAHAAALVGDLSIADVAERVTPSVVSVFSERELPLDQMHPFFSDPLLRRFFGQPSPGMPQEHTQRGLGSGVIISSDGIVLTNNHVVENADKVQVGFADGKEVDAEIVGTDPKSDVAVLRLKGKGFPAIALADSTKNRVGDVVLAVGNPFGLSHSVTMGIISALGRDPNIADYEDFIQTDAAINPGNSGGALVNLRGELVGLNTAIVSRSGGYQGIGFAIPTHMAINVKDSILQHGHVVRGWLGVYIQDLTEELAETMQLSGRKGVLVSDVSPGGPGDKAGIQRGDVIVSVDGTATDNVNQLRNLIAAKGATSVQLAAVRGGKTKSFRVKLGELPSDEKLAAAGPSTPGDSVEGVFAGLQIRELDTALRRRAEVPESVKGVLVVEVQPGSAAERFGLHPGDVIMEVNRTATADLASFRKAAKAAQSKVLLLVYRKGSTIFLAVRR